jgi:hypothetical protein
MVEKYPLEREPLDRVRARMEALLKANAAPRCGARSKRTGEPCQGAAMPNGRCKFHGGKSTGPRTPEGLEPAGGQTWALFAGSQGGTVALLDLRPRGPTVGYGPRDNLSHWHICQWQRREGFRAQPPPAEVQAR